MSWLEAAKIGSVVLTSLGGGAAIVIALSSWLGKVWATRLMQNEQAKHDAALEHLRAQLHQQTTNEIELVKRQLDIAATSHLREVQEKLAIYRLVADLVADILGDFDRASWNGVTLATSRERYDQFNKGRMKAYGYMAMLAPQAVMDAFDAVIDHLLVIAQGKASYEWPIVRPLAIALLNEIRKDVGLDKAPIEYRGKP
jgi:hypothetical protein